MTQTKKKKLTAEQEAALAMRVPPHSDEAERGILGSLMISATDCLDKCSMAGLHDGVFYDNRHQRIYRAIVDVVNSEKGSVDLMTVTDRLKTVNALSEAGGERYLNRVLEETVTTAHLPYYLDIVMRKYTMREILRVTREAQDMVFLGTDSDQFILSQAQESILRLSMGREERDETFDEAMEKALTGIRESYKGRGAMAGMMTGLRDLDRVMQGLRPTEMVVLAARPSMGKTSLAMNIAENLASGLATGERVPVGVFSCEMSRVSLLTRMICAHAGVSMRDVTQRMMGESDLDKRLRKAQQEIQSLPIWIDETGGLDVSEMRTRARRMKKNHGVRLILIDYLQLLNSRERKEQGRQLETAHISASIKNMAKELQVPVVVLSQLSRGPESRDGRPRLSDLRDSGAIEQDADVCMMLRRPCKTPSDPQGTAFPDLAIVDIAKNRNGECGEVKLRFDSRATKFSDWEEPRVQTGMVDYSGEAQYLDAF